MEADICLPVCPNPADAVPLSSGLLPELLFCHLLLADVGFVFNYKFPVMNFLVKNMFFDSIPFEVHFTEINSIQGEKLIVFKSDPQDDIAALTIEKNRSEWRSVKASSVTALFFKNGEHFPEQ